VTSDIQKWIKDKLTIKEEVIKMIEEFPEDITISKG
jgi:hypothetical protein